MKWWRAFLETAGWIVLAIAVVWASAAGWLPGIH